MFQNSSMMRNSGVLLIFFLLQIAIIALSQNSTVSLHANHISLEQLFTEIEKQTDLKFLYRYENISGKFVNVDFTNQTVYVVLDESLTMNGLQYSVMENNLIVVSPDEMAAKQIVTQQVRYISGRITEAGTGNSIPAATVIITNSTEGTSTDTTGYYQLKIPGEGSYLLAVSHVGYQSAFMDIKPGNTSLEIDMALNERELDEVKVLAKTRFRQRDINLFWNKILGKNPSKRTIQADNPKVVYYYYNSETRILKVTCREPLKIINYETGYYIQYMLDHFTHDYNTGITDWSYQYFFTELEPNNLQQKDTWEKNRIKVYNVSITKFIKSLYNNSLQKDGFVLATYELTTEYKNNKIEPEITRMTFEPRNPILLYSLNPGRLLSKVAVDKSRIFNLSNKQILLICYGRPVTDNDLNFFQRSKSDALYVNLLLGDSICIFPDGTYTHTLHMSPVNQSNTLLGLHMRLPIEYIPETKSP